MIKSQSYTNKKKISESGLEDFFEKTFKCFEKEINSLSTTRFKDKESHKVYALIERAWIGVLNNAIIRAFQEDAVILQEFAVYDKNKKLVGRSDMLVRWVDKSQNEFYLLFEAKCHEELNESYLFRNSDYFKNVIKQVNNYHDTEIEYYNGKNVLLIPIVFGWIRKKNVLEMAKEFFSSVEKEDILHFCHLYHDDDEGMWVYGQIYRPGKFITSYK